MFIKRDAELQELKSDKLESILIYGRRRVGKSKPIRLSSVDCHLPIVNFECEKSSHLLNLENLTKVFFKNIFTS